MASNDDISGYKPGDRVDVRIGLELTDFRKAAGLDLKAAAAGLAVSEAAIKGFEAGTLRVPARVLLVMAQTYGFTLEALFQRLSTS
jgi:transcriptional regulator with XRE-family HTH domain